MSSTVYHKWDKWENLIVKVNMTGFILTYIRSLYTCIRLLSLKLKYLNIIGLQGIYFKNTSVHNNMFE